LWRAAILAAVAGGTPAFRILPDARKLKDSRLFGVSEFMNNSPALLLVLFLAGCATPGELPAFQPVSKETAVVRWQRGKVSLTGEAVCARSQDGGTLIRLYKHSRSPLLELRLEPDGLLAARGSLAGAGWTGPYSAAPMPLATWVSFLSIYQHARDLPVGAKELHTAAARIAYEKTGAGLKSLSIASTDQAETISGFFR